MGKSPKPKRKLSPAEKLLFARQSMEAVAPPAYLYRTVVPSGLTDFVFDFATPERPVLDESSIRKVKDSISCSSKERLEALGHSDPWQVLPNQPFDGAMAKRGHEGIIVFPVAAIYSKAKIKFYKSSRVSPKQGCDPKEAFDFAHVAIFDKNYDPPASLALSTIIERINDTYSFVHQKSN